MSKVSQNLKNLNQESKESRKNQGRWQDKETEIPREFLCTNTTREQNEVKPVNMYERYGDAREDRLHGIRCCWVMEAREECFKVVGARELE